MKTICNSPALIPLSQAEPAALAGLADRLTKEADNMQYNDDLDSMDDGIKLMREAAAALSPAHAGVQVKALTELLREIRDNGLIYWVPTTDKGLERRNDIIARIDDFLATPPAAGARAVPVAWQWRYKHINESAIWSEWGSYDPALSSYSDYVEEKRPLYAAPASPVGEER